MKSVKTTPLAEFLSQPNIEASPAWELIDGKALQKPMPDHLSVNGGTNHYSNRSKREH